MKKLIVAALLATSLPAQAGSWVELSTVQERHSVTVTEGVIGSMVRSGIEVSGLVDTGTIALVYSARSVVGGDYQVLRQTDFKVGVRLNF